MKNNKFLCVLFFLFTVFSLWGNEGKELLKNYEITLTRIRYSKTPGFCHDGDMRIKEKEVKGSETSFCVKEPNIYLKVKNIKENKIYYTRHFNLIENNGKLTIQPDYHIQPSVRISGHCSLVKIGKKLNITSCHGETCKNAEIYLYEMEGEPIAVKDGIFFIFDPSKEKKASNATIGLNIMTMPIIDLKEEEAKMTEILKKMEKYFTASEIKEKKDSFYKILKTVK